MSEVARPEQPKFRETLIDVGRWVASSGVAGADVVAAEIERALATPAKVETLDAEYRRGWNDAVACVVDLLRAVKAGVEAGADPLKMLASLAKDPSPGGSDE